MHSVDKFAMEQSERALRASLEFVTTVDSSSKTTKDYLDALMLLKYEPKSQK